MFYEDYQRFEEGREDVSDDERVGQLSTSITAKNVNKIEKTVFNNRYINII